MISQLLDILPYGERYHRPVRVIIDTARQIRVKPKPVVTDSVSSGANVADTATVPQQAADSASAIHNVLVTPGSTGGDSTLLWVALAAVLVALALCLYFVYTYRRSLLAGNR